MTRTIAVSLVCMLSLSLSPTAAAAPDSSALEPSAPSPLLLPLRLKELPQLDAASWKEEHTTATTKKRRGRLLTWVGAGVTGLGVLMITRVDAKCGRFVCEYDYRLPTLVTSAGAGVLVWGIQQQRDATRTLRELERQRTSGALRQIPIVVTHGTSVSIGDGFAVRQVWRW